MILLRKLRRGILAQFYAAVQDPTAALNHSLPAALALFPSQEESRASAGWLLEHLAESAAGSLSSENPVRVRVLPLHFSCK